MTSISWKGLLGLGIPLPSRKALFNLLALLARVLALLTLTLLRGSILPSRLALPSGLLFNLLAWLDSTFSGGIFLSIYSNSWLSLRYSLQPSREFWVDAPFSTNPNTPSRAGPGAG